MSTIANIDGTDLITDSRADINQNFANLNNDKMETSVLDTDTTLAANSDAKVPTQKAVKAYVDAGGNVNATETTKGIVEVATQAEVDAGTATGSTGATLVVTPATLVGGAKPTVHQYVAADSPATWTKPTGLKYVVVECQGAGGSGGTDGSGGGGGGYTKKVIAASSCGATETVTIGAGSVGTGNTSFGSLLTAGNGGNASGTTAGTAGAATGGDVNVAGQAGSSVNHNGFGGSGGNSVLGFGAGDTINGSSTGTKNGTAGAGYGGGGSGGAAATDGSPSGGTGGAGAQGTVIVTEYYV